MDIIEQVKQCNVSYHVLGKSDRSAMPIGNGELCASVWTDAEGKMNFYLSRSDALTELDRTVKLGLVQVSVSPNPFKNGDFCQELDVADGCLAISGTGARIWMCVDSQTDQIVIRGESETDVTVMAEYFTWRDRPVSFQGESAYRSSIQESADVVSQDGEGILFYHKNGENIIAETARIQEVDGAIELLPDFLTDRIFGGYLFIEGGGICAGKAVKESVRSFTIRVLTASIQGKVEEFRKKLLAGKRPFHADEVKERCRRFWNRYWENSYIFVAGDAPAAVPVKEEMLREAAEPSEYNVVSNSPVTTAYVLTRFMMKCCQQGAFPILYNGMLFNLCPGKGKHFSYRTFGEVYTAAPEKPTYEINPDERSWCVEHLWQNVRHPYHTFLAQGEADALKVLFRYYRNFWEINRFRAKKYYQAEGQHNTEMTLSFGLQSIGIYGADRTGKPAGYAENRHGGAVDISPGLELLALMLDYYDYTGDAGFFGNEVIVYAKDLYRYIETRFTKRENGKLVIGPLNSIETYWDTTNPLPVIAGLRSTCERILRAEDTGEADRQYFHAYQSQIPSLCIRREDGEDYIQPAEIFDAERHNIEIPELYACFPFELYHGQNDPDGVMRKTFAKRLEQFGGNQCYKIGSAPDYPSYSGWQYFGIAAARLGMTEMARDILAHNVQLKNPGTRFPAMWGPIYDGVPDTDHGANIIHQLQEMVMQVRDGKIYLMPAFPKEWDVSFRLHPDKNTVITATYEKGRLKKLEVKPESERKRIF